MFNKIKSLYKISYLEIWMIVIFFLSIVSLSLFLDNGNDYKANLITEMASIILTAGIVAIFYKQSQKKKMSKKIKI